MTHAIEHAAADRQPRTPGQVFSQRLTDFLDHLLAGEAPNAGSFCAFCYNPLPRDYTRCDHCGQDLQERAAVSALPQPIIAMYRQKLKRESVIVNAFAFLGLGLGLALFLALVAVNVLYMEKAFWFFVAATVIFLVASRMLAGILGGVLGDEIGYKVASRRLHEDWTAYLIEREKARAE
jgi:hypothetical protein